MRHKLPAQVFFPSQLQLTSAAEFWLAGRLQMVGSDWIELHDALVTCRVCIPGGCALHDFRTGELWVIQVRRAEALAATATTAGFDGSNPEGCAFVHLGNAPWRVGEDLRHRQPQAPASMSEVARLARRGRAHKLVERARLMAVVRRFFEARGSLEVETPVRVESPGLDIHLDALALDDGRYLTTSPEYHMKRLVVGGLPRVHQIVRCFRRGEVGPRHNPEFTMLEWYRALASFEDILQETEALVVEVATAARRRPELVTSHGRVVDLAPPFERLPISHAFERHTKLSAEQALSLGLDPEPSAEERWFRLLVEEVEPALAEGPPVFLVDYPVTQASLARRSADDPRVCERFELFVGGVELCNGFGELIDATEQRTRLLHDQARRRNLGLPVYPVDEAFLQALSEGLPPCVGNALGLDRLIAMALGARTIGDVWSFPEHDDIDILD